MNKLIVFLTTLFFTVLCNAQDSSKVFQSGSIVINTKVISRECFVAKNEKVYTLYKLQVLNVLSSDKNIADTINTIVFGGSTEYALNNGPFDWGFLKEKEQYVISMNDMNIDPILNKQGDEDYFRLIGEKIKIQNSSRCYASVNGTKYSDNDSFVQFLKDKEELSVTSFDTKVEFKIVTPTLTEEEKRIKRDSLRNSRFLNKKKKK